MKNTLKETIVFAVVNTKGGAGKTTFTANFGGILADMGQNVLLIDADFQPSLSSHYKIKERARYGLKSFITNGVYQDCISKTEIDNLDIIISDDPDLELETWLRRGATNFLCLRSAIMKLKASSLYDYIIIDSEGTVKSEMQESIIVAADRLLAPIIPDYKPAKEFTRGFVRTLNRVKPPEGMGHMYAIPETTAFINAKDRTNDNVNVDEHIREHFRDGIIHGSDFKISVMDTVIPNLASYNKACGLQLPVHRVEKKRYNTSTPSALETMMAFVYEICPELTGIEVSE